MIRRTRWSEVESEVENVALACAKGSYQKNIVKGVENLSGSSLRGEARGYGGRYAQSRASLIRRMREAGLFVSERRAERGARILVIQQDDRGAGI